MEGKILGARYQIISELGKGGFGQTYLAEDKQLPGNPKCVVKQLKPNTTDTSTLETARRLFDTEAEVLYKLGNHDQIPRLFAHFEENREFYLVQEFIEGHSLKEEIVEGQILAEERVIILLEQMLQVLEFVHQEQVIHRDIKPANLIIRKNDNNIVLIDFGAVKQINTTIINAVESNSVTVAIGSMGYMPNEQLAGTPRFSSDIYAVGMMAIRGLTGLHPARLKQHPKSYEIIWKELAEVSQGLTYVIDKMVRYDCRDRYDSATAALADLKNLHFYNSGIITATVTSKQSRKNTQNDPNIPTQTPTRISRKQPKKQPSNSHSRKYTTPVNSPTKTSPKKKLASTKKQTKTRNKNQKLPPFILHNQLKSNWWALGLGIVFILSATQAYSHWQLRSLLVEKNSKPSQTPSIYPVTETVSQSQNNETNQALEPEETDDEENEEVEIDFIEIEEEEEEEETATNVINDSFTSAAETEKFNNSQTQSSGEATNQSIDIINQLNSSMTQGQFEAAEAIAIISTIHKQQQIFYLENRRFADKFNSLGLNLIPQTKNENYQYQIAIADTQKTIITATPKKEGLKSYSGAVLVDNDRIAEKICQSDRPTRSYPYLPQVRGNNIQCPGGYLAISGF